MKMSPKSIFTTLLCSIFFASTSISAVQTNQKKAESSIVSKTITTLKKHLHTIVGAAAVLTSIIAVYAVYKKQSGGSHKKNNQKPPTELSETRKSFSNQLNDMNTTLNEMEAAFANHPQDVVADTQEAINELNTKYKELIDAIKDNEQVKQELRAETEDFNHRLNIFQQCITKYIAYIAQKKQPKQPKKSHTQQHYDDAVKTLQTLIAESQERAYDRHCSQVEFGRINAVNVKKAEIKNLKDTFLTFPRKELSVDEYNAIKSHLYELDKAYNAFQNKSEIYASRI